MTIRVSAAFGLAAFAAAAFAMPAAADTREDVMQRAEHCIEVKNGRQWLECYYAAAQPLRAELGLPAAPQAQSFEQLFAQAPPKNSRHKDDDEDDSQGFFNWLVNGKVIAVPPAQFGLKDAKPGPGYNIDHLVAKLASYDLHGGRGVTVTLANGQIWTQDQGDTEIAHWTQPAANYTATINHAALGTYSMVVREKDLNLNSVYKMSRIK